MGDRRILLGTSAVLVGLSSALISGTAVAAADTGETDTKPTDTSASGSDVIGPPRPLARRAHRNRPAARGGRGRRVRRTGPHRHAHRTPRHPGRTVPAADPRSDRHEPTTPCDRPPPPACRPGRRAGPPPPSRPQRSAVAGPRGRRGPGRGCRAEIAAVPAVAAGRLPRPPHPPRRGGHPAVHRAERTRLAARWRSGPAAARPGRVQRTAAGAAPAAVVATPALAAAPPDPAERRTPACRGVGRADHRGCAARTRCCPGSPTE